MTREIKFRAWDKETKEMSYDFLNKNWLLVCIKSPYVELMQYTGLKDKNGKEIYEGDIVKSISKTIYPFDNYRESDNYHTRYYRIGWHESKGRWNTFKGLSDEHIGIIGTSQDICEKFYEVIGNIYENTELLEVNTP